MIWHILNIETLEIIPYKKLSTLVRDFGFTESTVRNKWSKAQKENIDFIIIDKYRITKVELK